MHRLFHLLSQSSGRNEFLALFAIVVLLLAPLSLVHGSEATVPESASPTSPAISLSRIVTGTSAGALESTVVDGGSWVRVRHLIHQAIVIEHPQGRFLFDTGVGRKTAMGFEKNSWLNRHLFAYRPLRTVAEALLDGGLSPRDFDGIWLSHLHWDHSGGLPDLAGVPTWVTDEALADARAGGPPAFFSEHLEAEGMVWRSLTLEQRDYRGFPRSRDWFGDGALVLVDLSGHTRGHVGLFVNLPDGRSFFFIGDTTWTLTGIEQNRPRPQITQWLTGVDHDREQNSAQIARIVALREADPSVTVIPAHDEHAADGIPEWPERLTVPIPFMADNLRHGKL